ncbi:hypothetical protein [Pararhizobium mangrovi]|uniref:Glutamine amidotransferase domain-containing protein n=1 Tax=Pararhizobium mangrovi TaxID=2590452 RepID=A0A506UHS7_9HYPH|nr:hypothetical protein [Pararhizobium mangrovi]TPW32866.1 hypothetical protein FJU11_01185 [Pararhizobium mangrovi]
MSFAFDPLLPVWLIVAAAVAAAVLVALGLVRGVRGTAIRAIALAALVLALVNPVLFQEQRDPLKSVVAVIVDRTQSQQSDERRRETDAALAQVKQKLSRYPQFEVRVAETTNDPGNDSPSSRLFETLSSTLQDVPTARVAGAIMITDGEVHDIPSDAGALGFKAPVHALITGHEGETDRRIEVVRAPRFGIVGEEQTIYFRVNDDGKASGDTADVDIRLNGEETARRSVPVGEQMPFTFKVPRGGQNIVEFSTPVLDGEITPVNNETVALMDGIRQNLRVLLVSGEPHSGERSWRNLLKADPSVDLVHFTILRPPEKQDGTPIDELSLIAFPTRELFVQKIDQFDLIVLDRYQRRGVLPILYYDNIARYVRDGGALLVAAGPEYAGSDTIADTPLASVLPAMPTGSVAEKGFRPRLSDAGKKHPVTRDLPGAGTNPPDWGRWFRTIDTRDPKGETVLTGADDEPLLVLDRVEKGRVAMLLSDDGWLWARDFEGGGPYVDLYRRIAHWLMKEPSLDEEALRASAKGHDLTIERQTMGDSAPDATVTMPDGSSRTVPLKKAEPGLYRATMRAPETGLFTVKEGDKTALAHVGAVNAPEFRRTVSTTERLAPITDATHGVDTRVAPSGGSVETPPIIPVDGEVRSSSGNRIALQESGESVLRGVNRMPLFAGFLGLAILLLALGSTWYREGR